MTARTLLAATFAVLASTAFAGTEPEVGEHSAALPTFTTLDVNHDGSLTRDEAGSTTAVIEQWDKLDTDHNDALSSTEYGNVNLDIENDVDTE
jgi:hypothetical protein